MNLGAAPKQYDVSSENQLRRTLERLLSSTERAGPANSGIYATAWGAQGDGVTDDTLAIQRAIDAANAKGGGVVTLTPGDYPISHTGVLGGESYCLQLKSFVTLCLLPGARLVYTGATLGSHMVFALGVNIAATTLASDAAAGDTAVEVTSAAGLAVGQDVLLGRLTLDGKDFEINQITGIAGTTISLATPTSFDYTTANSAELAAYQYVERANVTGGGVVDGNYESGDCIKLGHAKHCQVTDMICRNTDPSGTGRGILFSSSSHRCTATRNTVLDVADRGIETYVKTSYNTIRDNVVMNAAIHGIAVHGYFNLAEANRVTGCGTDPDSHANLHVDSGQHLRITGNSLAGSKGRGFQIAGGTVASVIVSDNTIVGSTTHQLFCANMTGLTVSGNRLRGGLGLGLYLDNVTQAALIGNVVTDPYAAGLFCNIVDELTVDGNRVSGSVSDIGIYLSTVNRATVTGNTSRGNYNDGFRLNVGDHISVVGNAFTGNGQYGVRFITTPTGSQCVGNDLSGNTTAPLSGDVAGARMGNAFSTGANQGQAVLVGGTVTVTTAEVVAGDSILLTRVVSGGTAGHLSVGTITAGTSFVINSSNGADTSTVFWQIIH